MQARKRVIAHLDCDAFFVSVELRRRPELRGLPVIVAGSGPRAVVTTASYEARVHGVGSAMSAAEARRRCPQAHVLPPDHDEYKRASAQVWAIAGAHLPVLERLGLDEAFADMSGLKRPLPRLRAVIAEILERTSIQISAGIAPNRLVAKIASDLGKPAGFVAIGREAALRTLSDRSVRIVPGIGPKSAERLARAGCRTLGDLQRLGEPALLEMFGPRHGAELHRRAFLHDDSPVTTTREIKSRSTETTFDHDISEAALVEPVIARMACELGDGLRRSGLRARNVAIKIRLDDFTTVTRARTLSVAVDSDRPLAEVAVELFRTYAPTRPVRLVGVRVASFAGEDTPAQVGGEQLVLPVCAAASPGPGTPATA